MKKKKYLLIRFGGIGDTAPVMAVARYLKLVQGHEVDIAFRDDNKGQSQIDLLENTDCFDKSFTYKEVGPSRSRCVEYKNGWKEISGIYDNYDEVIDYMYIIESNSVCQSDFQAKPSDEWKKHRNSNWVNWYDLHFAWANINPNEVEDKWKRPVYELSKEEIDESASIMKGYEEVIVINPSASSLARTWYQAEKLIPKFLEKYPNAVIFYWTPKEAFWAKIDKKGTSKYTSPIKSALRASICVIDAASIYIGADTGLTHIAEGLDIRHIAIYSSVPSWTRSKYYQFQTVIDKGPHSFALMLGDPLRIEEGFEKLSKKEKKILSLQNSGMPVEVAAIEMNTTPEGLSMELQSIQTKIAASERIQSKSLTKVTVEEVFDLSIEILEEGIK